jgi:hypothetical protein
VATKTRTVKIELPIAPDDVIKQLKSLDDDPAMIAADRLVRDRRAALDAAREELQRLDSIAIALPARVVSGHSTNAHLETALIAVRRQSLLIAPATAALADAEAAMTRTVRGAKQRKLSLVQDWIAAMLAADSQLVALLDRHEEQHHEVTVWLHRLCGGPRAEEAPFDLRYQDLPMPARAMMLISSRGDSRPEEITLREGDA